MAGVGATLVNVNLTVSASVARYTCTRVVVDTILCVWVYGHGGIMWKKWETQTGVLNVNAYTTHVAGPSIQAGVGVAVINVYITVSPCPPMNTVTSVIIYQVLRDKCIQPSTLSLVPL